MMARRIWPNGDTTMGGALVLTSIAVATVLWADPEQPLRLGGLFVMIGFGAIGWVDDYRKVVHKNPKGMSARKSSSGRPLIGLIASTYLAFAVSAPSTGKIFNLIFLWVQSGFTNDLPSKADLIVRSSRTLRTRWDCSASLR